MFPDEILELVFQQSKAVNLTQLRRVCRAWYQPATLFMFEKVQFVDLTQVDAFLGALAEPSHPTLLSVGPLVKEIEFGPDFGGDYELNFENDWESPDYKEDFMPVIGKARFNKILKYCPNVEKTTYLNPNLEDELLCLLADVDESSRWKHLKILPECNFNIQYKYRHSLTRLSTEKTDYDNFEFLKEFPCIEKLDIPSAPLDTMEKLESILSNCPRLQELYAAVLLDYKTGDNRQSISRPSVKKITIANYDELRQKSLIEYLLYVCSNMKFLGLFLDDEQQEVLKGLGAFNSIVAHMYATTSFDVCLNIGNLNSGIRPVKPDHHIYPMLRNYFDCLFKPLSRGNIDQFHVKLTMGKKINRFDGLVKMDIGWKKRWDSKSSLNIELATHGDIDLSQNIRRHFEKYTSHINEIEAAKNDFDIHDAEEVNPLSTLIENYRNLKTVSLTRYSLGSVRQYTNKSLEHLTIKSCYVITQMFSDISSYCHNLKSLCLEDNEYNTTFQQVPNQENNRVVSITMPRTSLQTLDFKTWSTCPNMNETNLGITWLMNVKTCDKDVYYKLAYPDLKAEKITIEHFIKLASLGATHQVIIQCGIIQRFKLNGEVMEL